VKPIGISPRRARLFLIDGSSYIYRAFFALPPAVNSAGFPTNATYGFINFMLKLLKRHQPEYLAVVLDAGRETFRNQMFADYKPIGRNLRRVCFCSFRISAEPWMPSTFSVSNFRVMRLTISSVLFVRNYATKTVI
jgi:5'-3' exonuclease, N-terminal resolvase-like domain